MTVALHAKMCDQSTSKIADALHHPFKIIGGGFTKNYGGTIDHLWIDFELIRSHCELRPPKPFRFQKRVGGGRCSLTGLLTPVNENVGHYSVRPDFGTLLSLPLESAAGYAFSLIYESTLVLEEKSKRLGGFAANVFRDDFLSICEGNGYRIRPSNTYC